MNWLCVFALKSNVADSKSRHRLFFYPMRKGGKEQERPWLDFEFGRYIIQREGVSTLCIHGYPWALNCLTHLCFPCLRKCLRNVVCLENILKGEFNFVMILVRMYTKCLSRLIFCIGNVLESKSICPFLHWVHNNQNKTQAQ